MTEENGARPFHVIYEIFSENVTFMQICKLIRDEMQDKEETGTLTNE